MPVPDEWFHVRDPERSRCPRSRSIICSAKPTATTFRKRGAARTAKVPRPPKDPLTEPAPWNAVAVGYDEETFEQIPELVEKALSVLAAGPESTVLDLATGEGASSIPGLKGTSVD